MVTVSVIVCTYNQEITIRRTLDAILAQQCDCDYEVIIGEDASIDNTRKICEEYVDKFPDIVRLMPKSKNKGIVDNYYDCVREAKGKYIMECGGDDEWCPGRIQLCLDAMRKYPEVVQIFTQVYYRKESTGEISEPTHNLFPFGLLKGSVVIDGMMHQRSNQPVSYAMTLRNAVIELIDEYPSFFKGRKYYAEDKQLTVLLGTKGSFLNLPNRTYYYTIDTGSITRGNLMKHLRYNVNMLILNRDLSKAVGYKGTMLPLYLNIIYVMCRLTIWRGLRLFLQKVGSLCSCR